MNSGMLSLISSMLTVTFLKLDLKFWKLNLSWILWSIQSLGMNFFLTKSLTFLTLRFSFLPVGTIYVWCEPESMNDTLKRGKCKANCKVSAMLNKMYISKGFCKKSSVCNPYISKTFLKIEISMTEDAGCQQTSRIW